MVLSVNDAHWMRDNRVAACRAQIVGAESLQNLVGEPIRRGQRQLESRPISDPAPVQIGRLNILFLGQNLDLGGRTVDQQNPDAQRAENSDIQQDIGEILAGNNCAIDANDKNLFRENAGYTAECLEGRLVSRYVIRRVQLSKPFPQRFNSYFQWEVAKRGPPSAASRHS